MSLEMNKIIKVFKKFLIYIALWILFAIAAGALQLGFQDIEFLYHFFQIHQYMILLIPMTLVVAIVWFFIIDKTLVYLKIEPKVLKIFVISLMFVHICFAALYFLAPITI